MVGYGLNVLRIAFFRAYIEAHVLILKIRMLAWHVRPRSILSWHTSVTLKVLSMTGNLPRVRGWTPPKKVVRMGTSSYTKRAKG